MFSPHTAMIGLACAFFTLHPAGVEAQPPTASDVQARVHYDAGRLYYDSERYEEALREFREAYRLSPRPALLYNQATALDRLGRATEAVALYQVYLDTEHDSPLRAEIEERIQTLRPAEGPETGDLSTTADGSESVDVERASTPGSARGVPVSAMVGFGVAGALVAGAVTTGILALGVHGDLREQCGESSPCPSHLESEVSRGERLTLITDILGGIALLAAATAVTLWVLDDGGDEDAEVSLAASLGGLRLEVSF